MIDEQMQPRNNVSSQFAGSEKIEMNGQTVTLFHSEGTHGVDYSALVTLGGTTFQLFFKRYHFVGSHTPSKRIEKGLVRNRIVDALWELTKPLNDGWRRVWPNTWVFKLNPNGFNTQLELWEN